MKKIVYLLFMLPIMVLGQTQSENYIKTTTYKVPTTINSSPTDAQKVVKINYFDGLGRPIQQIAYKQSASGKDIVTPIEYDAFGRQVKDYLPYARSTMASLDYSSTALTDVGTYYNLAAYDNTLNPFSEKLFEASPLNRVLEQGAPGTDWGFSSATKHTIRFDYQTNTATDAVKLFAVTATWDATKGLYDISTSLTATTYADNQLYKTVTKNENWVSGNNNTVEEFKDKEGHVILKRTYGVSMVNGVATSIAHDTYYVYDQFGNLTFVIPPLVDVSTTITQAILDKLCYQYKYDYRNRLVEKKLPGKQWEFMVYDKLDRVVATGPTNSPFTNLTSVGWLLTKYDVFNRPVLTAWQPSTTVTSAERKTLQDLYSAATLPLSETKTTTNTTVNGVSFRYTNAAIPTANATLYHVLTVNYYDDYDSNLVFAPAISFTANADVYYDNTSHKPKGLPTMSWVRVPTTSAAISFEQSYTLYDAKARAVTSFTRNYLGGFTQTDTKLDFAGKVNYTITTHKRANSTTIPLLTIREDFTYSDQDRLLLHTHTINGATTPQLIAQNTYNELGQLISKNVGRAVGNPIQKVDYSYNIRGWLKGINDVTNLTDPAAPSVNAAQDLFAFKLNYNTQDNTLTGVKNLYNGNISETLWRSNKDNVLRSYGYTYDDLNRLRNAQYIRPVNPLLSNSSSSPIVNTFNESMVYDKNGNILALQRNGGQESQTQAPLIDDLVYQYDGNQLTKVDDFAYNNDGFKDDASLPIEYTYDLNGNMTSDQNKGITAIVYNHLNLPTRITMAGGAITYVYNALGQKVSKTVNTTNTNPLSTSVTEYLGGFQYNNNVLQFFSTAEGYVKNTVVNGVNTYDYIFNYTDHLGNIRLSYGIDPSTQNLTTFEENNYYPFGLKHETYNYQLVGIVNPKDDPLLDTSLDTKVAKTIVLGNLGKGQATVPNSGYQYKYQGQERQDELGLNWDSFKYRNYDYAIGRFMNIDPLTEQYNTWSPYAFSGNRVIDAREIEGLEPHVLFGTMQQAADNFGQQYNGYSINQKVEVGTQFYKQTDADGESCYGYTNPVQGVASMMDTSQATGVPDNAVVSGDAHTHANENDSSTIRIYDKVTNNIVENKEMNLSNISGFEIKSSSNTTNENDVEKAQTNMNNNENFKSSYTFTPSGLVYSTQNINGTATPKVNVNLSRTNPSDPNSVMPMNKNPTSPNAPLPQVVPKQITIPIKN